MAAHLFMESAALRCRAAAIVFMDVKGAFYSILPELAVGPLLAQDKRRQLFRNLGMSQAAADSLEHTIENADTILQRRGVSPQWRSALADW